MHQLWLPPRHQATDRQLEAMSAGIRRRWGSGQHCFLANFASGGHRHPALLTARQPGTRLSWPSLSQEARNERRRPTLPKGRRSSQDLARTCCRPPQASLAVPSAHCVWAAGAGDVGAQSFLDKEPPMDTEKGQPMTAILGSGEHRYRVVEDWAKLPDGWEFRDVASVAVDSKDRVYVFNRGEHPMIVFDREGNFIRSWGEGTFPRAHGLHIDANDILYCTDDGGHVVRKCTTEGKVLLEIGVPGKETPYMSGLPFHRCTHTALSPKGEIYVSDGYGNARIHKYS